MHILRRRIKNKGCLYRKTRWLLRADAPGVSDAVGDADTVELPLRVEEGVGGGVP